MLLFTNEFLLIVHFFASSLAGFSGAWGSPIVGSQDSLLVQMEQTLLSETNDSAWVVKAITLTRELHRRHHHRELEYEWAQSAVDRADQLNNPLLYARALDNLGLLHRYHQEYDQAIRLHKKAFELVRTDDVPDLYKMIFANNVGVAARYNQQYDLAVSYYLEALKLATLNQDLKNLAISSNGLGNALSSIPGKEDEAIDYFQKALAYERRRNDSLGMAMNLLSISDHHVKKKQHEQALSYLDTLWRINKLRGDDFGLAITHEFYGHVYFDQGADLEKAKSYYTRSLGEFKRLNNPGKVASILASLGNVNAESGRLHEALSYYNQALQLADSINHKLVILESAYRISEIKEQTGDFRAALRYYKKAVQYEDSIALDRQKTEIEALTRQFEVEKKETQIALLEKEKSLIQERISFQEEELRTHRIYLIILSVGALTILILLGIYFRNKRAKRRSEIALQEKEKRLLQAEYEKNIAQAELLASRMQVNPHFIFNSLNAIQLLIQKEEVKKAGAYLIRFSRFVRKVLELPQSQFIPLSEELDLVSHYLSLEEKRFDENVDFTIEKPRDADIDDVKIPPLLLQPFVENAIWHGLLPSRKTPKRLMIKITKIEDRLEIIIDDNGVGRRAGQGQANTTKKSMGMTITQQRIAQINKSYDCQIDLKIIDKKAPDDTGTAVVLNLYHIDALAAIPV